MTITVANVDTTTDSFGGWVTKTNIIADALTNKAVTTNSNTATGNSAITGSWTANAVYSNNFYGGTTALTANITFNSNATFIGARTKLGLGANVQIDSGNSTFRVLTVNSAASNTLVATKLTFSDHSDVAVTTASNAQYLVYSAANTTWYNKTGLSDIAVSTVSNGQFLAYNSANTTWYNRTGLVVYYANGDVAFS